MTHRCIPRDGCYNLPYQLVNTLGTMNPRSNAAPWKEFPFRPKNEIPEVNDVSPFSCMAITHRSYMVHISNREWQIELTKREKILSVIHDGQRIIYKF
ncbi:hypothetical protein AVEN_60725-1 [Araneus ventricosus]|uniref:Uncharacterized protein n=1 Tax=Araneus ventricosus TaxID=182803 RepID=A0A4Y2V2R0_ARAVE|nr:hypothetical protein AVEN_60725-1 [Araneus ventricosus]